MTRDITFLLYDQFAAIDAVGAADVFNTANDLAHQRLYIMRYVSAQGQARSSNGMTFATESLERGRENHQHTLMIPGAAERPLRASMANRSLLDFIKQTAETAERICSVCSGAFLLARAGLLDGRRATTHWRGMEQLVSNYPKIHIQRDVLFVQDGPVWTSAGVTAGIDMALAIVEQDHGRPLAMRVAREMVLFMVRPGGQTQFSAPLDLQQKSANTALNSLPFWLESRLERAVSVADMAEAMAMSERNFHRRCVATFALTPNGMLHRLRLERARTLLEEGALPLAAVASRCGFGDLSALGKSFRQGFGVTPGDYRAHFGKQSPASDPMQSEA